jgi:hypothetical protein
MARKRFVTSDMSIDEKIADIAAENPVALVGNIVRDIMNMTKRLLLKVLMILWQWKKVRMSNY